MINFKLEYLLFHYIEIQNHKIHFKRNFLIAKINIDHKKCVLKN